VTVTESVDLHVPPADSGAGRLLWTQMHRDDWGNPELFVLVYAAKSVPRCEGYQDDAGIIHQGRRSEPFLKTWRGAMNQWASGNCDVLNVSLESRSREFGRIPSLRSTRVCVLVSPSPPARPEASSPALRAPEPFLEHRRPLVTAL
jgi:hypothetical protein